MGACGGCGSECGKQRGVIRLGVDASRLDYLVALAGNPNTGKSTIFNALTGLKQHTGNWPGKTVTRAEGVFEHQRKRFKLIDLPGTYSLLSTTVDEEIARDFLLFGQPDVTIVVIDATCLERNLNLALQVVEITDRVVVCLNLMDEARRKGIHINDRQLSVDLGVPVVPCAARHKVGLDELVRTTHGIASGALTAHPRHVAANHGTMEAVDELVPMIQSMMPGMPSVRWIAMRLLEGDKRIRQALQTGELLQLAAALARRKVHQPQILAQAKLVPA